MTSNNLKFKISSSLKNIIGRDLITDDFIAVFELVKNSYDAYATKVNIKFEEDKITIEDNGKGMDYHDLLNKWLFVAYSAKKDGTEDTGLARYGDYRRNIQPKRYYAGAKGVGRFSCDRLGSYLKLITKDAGIKSKIEEIIVDWKKFEKNSKSQFVKINVEHNTLNKKFYPKLRHGTILEISNLNSEWNRQKLKRLKHSLEKLINPFQTTGTKSSKKFKFTIDIHAKNELNADKLEKNPREKINGPVKNFIFETLNVKTTQVVTSINSKGTDVVTKLIDRGELIYQIKEKNEYILENGKKPEYLSGVNFHMFYLNRVAKRSFSNLMGIPPVRFGSVFVYRNGFRVYPYGEPSNDVFEIDVRKAQGHYRYLGTRDLLGRIEITDDKEWFKETSSRDGGLIKNIAYENLRKCFLDKCLERLENYVVDIQWALEDKGETLEKINSIEGKSKIIGLVSALTNAQDLKLLKYNKKIISIVSQKLEENTDDIFEHLKKIASETGDKRYYQKIEKTQNRFKLEAEARKHAERELNDTLKENLFLKSIKSQSFDEIVSFMHQISISSSNVENYLNGIYKRIDAGMKIGENDLKGIIEIVTFENKKIMSIAKFATKANFKLFTESTTIDLVDYIEQYIFNVIKSVQSSNFKLKVIETKPFNFISKIKPIEINIIIDNLISNSKKSRAKNFEVRLSKISEDRIEISFIDDGIGIPKANINRIFAFGFTTTAGSGLGLFHVKKIVDELGGTIQVNTNRKKGAEFIISLNKQL